MTTFSISALKGRTGTLLGACFAAMAALALGGCESSSNLLAGAGQATPQTALTDPNQQQQPAGSTQTARVEIAPIIGAPENISRDLQVQLTSAMQRNKLTVAQGATQKGEYVLRGYIVAAREKTASKISYIWDVTDQTGKRAHRITGEELAAATTGDPWAGVNPQVLTNIADKTASQVATWYGGLSGVPVASAAPAAAPATMAAATPAPASAAPAQTPAATAAPTQTAAAAAPAGTPGPTTGSITGPVNALVPSVSGAPGDGSQSLTGAIQRELSKNGVSLATAASPQTYKVEGKVAMGQGKDGKQPIQIDWSVFDPKGKKLGTVSQKNEVPQGSLDGAWGKTADAAAQAAAQGIVKLLPKSN